MQRRVLRLSGQPDTPLLRGWLHFAALLIAVPLGAVLFRQSRAPVAVLSIGLYVVGLIALYAVSAGYHLLRWSSPARERMRRLDRAMIYLFIGACYTPLCVLAVGGTFGIVMLLLGWGAALFGAVAALTQRARAARSSLGYIVVGWLALLTFPRVATTLDASGFVLLVAGGLTYTVGSIVLAARRPDPSPRMFGYHEVWHAFVIAGSAFHYALFWRLAQP